MEQIYKFEAEHIGRSVAVALVKQLENAGVEVEAAGMDPVFSNCMYLCATVDDAGAEKIRDAIWELNRGASCEMSVITPDELDKYL